MGTRYLRAAPVFTGLLIFLGLPASPRAHSKDKVEIRTCRELRDELARKSPDPELRVAERAKLIEQQEHDWKQEEAIRASVIPKLTEAREVFANTDKSYPERCRASALLQTAMDSYAQQSGGMSQATQLMKVKEGDSPTFAGVSGAIRGAWQSVNEFCGKGWADKVTSSAAAVAAIEAISKAEQGLGDGLITMMDCNRETSADQEFDRSQARLLQARVAVSRDIQAQECKQRLVSLSELIQKHDPSVSDTRQIQSQIDQLVVKLENNDVEAGKAR